MKRIAMTVLMFGVLLLAGCGVSQAEYDKVVADLATCQEAESQLEAEKAQWEEVDKPALEQQVADLEDQITSFEQDIADLEAENEGLKQPALGKIPAEVVGTVTLEELLQLSNEFFPNATGGGISSLTRNPHPLVSLETLKDFLAKDNSDWNPPCHETSYNLCDELAFRLKDRWIKAGLADHSLGFIKLKITTPEGEKLQWLNVFITKEGGELTVYKVDPHNDTVTKITEPDPDVVYIFIGDRI